MKLISIDDTNEELLELIDQLDDNDGGVVITKQGKPVARIIRYKSNCDDLIGSMKDKIEIHGDIFSTGRRWEASDWEPDGQS